MLTRPMHRWLCRDTLSELRGVSPRVLDTRPAPDGVAGTWSDYFCGAGGSMKGFLQLPGAAGVIAVNHWVLAIETHNYNFPGVDHDQANVARTDPRRYPRTDFAWFSPECTWWSVARGDKCDYDTDQPVLDGLDTGDGDPDKPAAPESKWRSRMLMIDVVRFTEHHRYRGVVVENVPDILKWSRFDRWIADMRKIGYEHQVVTLNAAFSHAYGPPAPQLRDRVYVVFWLARYPEPDWDKWLRPQCWCTACGQVVRGIYTPKPGPRRAMRYGQRAQYAYRCPHVSCRGATVQPYILPALAAIDLSLPTQRIGDRKKPLAPATRTRVEAGVRQHYRPRTASSGATLPPLLVPVEARDGQRARPATEPMRVQTGRHQDALVVPLRNNGVAQSASEYPLVTLAAGGTHHAFVMRNNTARGDSGYLSTPLDEPLRTVTTEGSPSLVDWSQLLYSYDTGLMRPLVAPLPAQTTVEGDAVLGTSIDIDDCTLRMLAVKEIQAGQAFAPDFTLLGNAKRDKVKMLGNAVPPPCSRDIAAALMEAVCGLDYELYDFAQQLEVSL